LNASFDKGFECKPGQRLNSAITSLSRIAWLAKMAFTFSRQNYF